MSWHLEQLLDAERRAECERNDAERRAEEQALSLCERLTHGEVQAAREQVAAGSAS
jgi:hypothetical protein